MFLAKVIGNVEARVRLPGFESHKMVLLQPIDFNHNPIRWVVIALDASSGKGGGGAGVGSIVTFVEGREAANPFENPPLPVDACITSIVDSWEYHPEKPK